MMMHTTLEQLRELRLHGMVAGLTEQLTSTGLRGMSFEERLALLVERELHWRSDKKRERLLKDAKLKYPQAAIEDLDSRAGRGLAFHQSSCHRQPDWWYSHLHDQSIGQMLCRSQSFVFAQYANDASNS